MVFGGAGYRITEASRRPWARSTSIRWGRRVKVRKQIRARLVPSCSDSQCAIGRLIFADIYFWAGVAVGHFPCGIKNQVLALDHHRKVDFIQRIFYGMVVWMQTREEEQRRNTFHGKIIMIRTII